MKPDIEIIITKHEEIAEKLRAGVQILESELALLQSNITAISADNSAQQEESDFVQSDVSSMTGGRTFQCDTDDPNTTDKRETIEFRPADGTSDDHAGVLQMRNADGVTEETDAKPQFPSLSVDGSGAGSLDWNRIHSDDTELPLPDDDVALVGDGYNLARWNHVHPKFDVTGPDVGLPNGTKTYQILYWDGSKWTLLDPPSDAAVLAFDNNSSPKIHWAILDTEYKVATRDVSGTVVGDWTRAHA